MALSAKHRAALEFAAAGIKIFPCRVNGKEPAPCISHWMEEATTDVAQIDKWWADNPDYNLAFSPEWAGWAVVDLDGDSGLENWNHLCADHSFTDRTATVRTPSGGCHLYFVGTLRPTVGTKKSGLAPKVDTRGVGSYVLLPPSYVVEEKKGYEGIYQWADDREMLDLPPWVSEALHKEVKPASTAKGEPVTLAHLRSLLPFVGEASMGRNSWRDVVAAIRNCNVPDDDDESQRLALACEWSHGDLTVDTPGEFDSYDAVEELFWSMPPKEDGVGYGTILHAAREGGYSGASALPIETAQEAFGATLDKLKADMASAPSQRSKFTPIPLGEIQTRLKEPAWIIPGLIPANATIQICGKQKSFKTFLTLDMALGIAAGKETFGYTPSPLPVVYCVGENASAFGLKHVAAWRVARQADGDFPFWIIPAVPKAIFEDEVGQLIAEIKKLGIRPGVVVIDTATRALRGLDENSARDVGIFCEQCDRIREELSCSVIIIRHTGKDMTRGGRGSNVVEGDFDTLLEVERHDKTMAVSLRVADQRNALERQELFTFEGRPVANSLVFYPTTTAEHSRLTYIDKEFSGKKIGGALAKLGAFGSERVTSMVLMSELRPGADQEALGRGCKELNTLAKTVLRAYCEGEGKDRMWSIPSESQDDA